MRRLIWSLLPLLALPLPARATERATVKAWPLVYHAVDTEAGTARLEIAWPLIDARTAPWYETSLLPNLLSVQHNTVNDGSLISGLCNLVGRETEDEGHWRMWIFPFLWLGWTADSSHAVVFPLYFATNDDTANTRGYLFLVWRGERDYTRDENRHHQTSTTVFPVYWSSQREVNDTVTGQSQTVFPLFSRAEEHDHTPDLDRDTWRRSALLLMRWQGEQRTDKETKQQEQRQQWQIWPLLTFGSREGTDAAGTVTKSSYKQWVFPFYFRGGRNYYEKGTYLVLFPCWWDLRRPDSQIQALVPLGARIRDGDDEALNLLGPLFTRLKTREYTRYDALFPLFMVETGERTAGFRLWPFYSHYREDGEQESGSVCWPLAHWEEQSDGWSWWLFPFGGASRHSGHHDSRKSVHAGPLGLFYRHSTTTDTDDPSPRTKSSVLAGLWSTENGSTVRAWRFLWFCASEWRRTNDFGQIRESTTSTIPLLFRSERTLTGSQGGEHQGSHWSLLPLFGQRGWICQKDRNPDGSSAFSLLDPLWVSRTTAKSERDVMLLGGVAGQAERYLGSVTEHSLLYRLFRIERNSRRSTWELMPFADGMTSTRGDWSFQLLGGLFGYETGAERTRLRLAYLPVFTRDRPPPPRSEEELQQRARRYLAYALDYLKGRSPERAIVELCLAEPAFGDDPALYETLGDACVLADRTLRPDLLERVAQEIESSSRDYPSSGQWDVAGHEGAGGPSYGHALAAYEKAKALGGDSALLRRKLMQLTSDDDSKVAQYATALRDFPEDFGLRYNDPILWSQDTHNLDQDSEYSAVIFPTCQSPDGNAATATPAETLAKWQQLVRDFPRSARAHHGLLENTKWDMATRPQAVELALAAAQLPDLPEYQELYPAPDDRPGSYSQACARFALRKMETLAWRLGKTEEQLYWRQRAFETRLDWGLAFWKEGDRRQFIDNLRSLHEEMKTEDQLIPYLERAVADLKPDVEREAWQREIRRLKREASYLTTWELEAAGASRPLQGRLFDRYVNLRTALGTDGEATARCSVTLTSPQARDAVILLGFDERVRVELNGEEAFAGQSRIAVADEFRVPVMLRQGENRLVVETSNRKLAWGFFLRIADAEGNAIDDLVARAGGR